MNRTNVTIFPSKKPVLLAFAAVLVVGGLAYVVLYNPSGPSAIYSKAKTVDELSAEIANQDSDRDGLKDWEEALWKTDQNNPDSDGDGTPDGEEVANGRDPNKKGPKDALSTSSTNSGSVESDTPPSKIDLFSQQLLASYLSLKQQDGGILSPQSQQQIINQLSEEALANATAPKNYSAADIVISTDESDTAIRAYGEAMGAIIKRYGVYGDNELVIVKRALDTNNKDLLKKLDPIILAYSNMTNAFLKVSVPQSASTIHLDIINGLTQTKGAVEGLRGVFEDPLNGLVSFGRYQKIASFISNAFSRVAPYFKNHGIIYTQGSAGYAFTHVI